MSNDIGSIKTIADNANVSVKELTKSIKNLQQVSGSFKSITLDFSSFDVGLKSLSSIDGALGKIRDGYNAIKNVGFENIMAGMASQGSMLAGVYTSLNSALLSTTASIELQSVATTVCTAATSLFATTLEFLKANPLVAVVGAIGLVVGALALFSESEEKAKSDTELFAEAQAKKRKELDETTQSIKESVASTIESAKNSQVQIDVLKGYVDKLKELESQGINSNNLEQVKYYIDQINSMMPGTVKLVGEERLEWSKNEQEIEKNIKQLERKAKVEAYYDGYVESLKNESKLRSELTLAQSNYNSELENKNKLQEQFNALAEKYDEQGFLSEDEVKKMEEYQNQLDISCDKLAEYGETLDSAKSAYEANKQGADLYNLAIQNLDESLIASELLQLEEMTVMGEKGTSTWASLAAAREDCKERMKSAEGEELEAIKVTQELVNAELINKANVFDKTYEEMVQKLKDSGIEMTEKEEEQLQKSYETWKMSSEQINALQASGLDILSLMKSAALSKMNEEDQRQLANNVRLFAAAGEDGGLELCQNLATCISENNGKVTDEAKNIMDQINTLAKNTNPIVKITGEKDADSVTNAFNSMKRQLGYFSTIGVLIQGSVSATKRASSGFPDTGELFIAREAESKELMSLKFNDI